MRGIGARLGIYSGVLRVLHGCAWRIGSMTKFAFGVQSCTQLRTKQRSLYKS